MPMLMEELRAGVPITLLVDLLYAGGPDSAEILRREDADDSWLDALTDRTAPR